MDYELSNYPKNQESPPNNPDGSGNPPDFSSGDCNVQQELHFLKMPEPFVPEKNFQNTDSIE